MKRSLLYTLFIASLIYVPLFGGREEAIERLAKLSTTPFLAEPSGIEFVDKKDLTFYMSHFMSPLVTHLCTNSLDTILILEGSAKKILPLLYLLQKEQNYTFNYYGLSFGELSSECHLPDLLKQEDSIITYYDLKNFLQNKNKPNNIAVIGIETPEAINKHTINALHAALDLLAEIMQQYNPSLILYGASKVNDLGYGLDDKMTRNILRQKTQIYPLIKEYSPYLYFAEKIDPTEIELFIFSLKKLVQNETLVAVNSEMKQLHNETMKYFDNFW